VTTGLKRFRRAPRVVRETPAAAGLLLPTRGSAVAVDGDIDARRLRRGIPDADSFELGTLDGEPIYALAASEADDVIGLRDLATELDGETWQAASLATQLVDFVRTTRFCGVCAAPRASADADLGRTCPNGHETAYPRISPCAIVLVHDGGTRVLLGKRANWPVNRYSLLAGFVEPGESLEQCAAREVLEEVGVVVDELRYVGSQSWPFPSQLMLGFTARYASGEVVVDRDELESADWFELDNLPALPPPLSIARQILEQHTAETLSEDGARAAARAREEW
jgi:NAD+ diphosphatase